MTAAPFSSRSVAEAGTQLIDGVPFTPIQLPNHLHHNHTYCAIPPDSSMQRIGGVAYPCLSTPSHEGSMLANQMQMNGVELLNSPLISTSSNPMVLVATATPPPARRLKRALADALTADPKRMKHIPTSASKKRETNASWQALLQAFLLLARDESDSVQNESGRQTIPRQDSSASATGANGFSSAPTLKRGVTEKQRQRALEDISELIERVANCIFKSALRLIPVLLLNDVINRLDKNKKMINHGSPSDSTQSQANGSSEEITFPVEVHNAQRKEKESRAAAQSRERRNNNIRLINKLIRKIHFRPKEKKKGIPDLKSVLNKREILKATFVRLSEDASVIKGEKPLPREQIEESLMSWESNFVKTPPESTPNASSGLSIPFPDEDAS